MSKAMEFLDERVRVNRVRVNHETHDKWCEDKIKAFRKKGGKVTVYTPTTKVKSDLPSYICECCEVLSHRKSYCASCSTASEDKRRCIRDKGIEEYRRILTSSLTKITSLVELNDIMDIREAYNFPIKRLRMREDTIIRMVVLANDREREGKKPLYITYGHGKGTV